MHILSRYMYFLTNRAVLIQEGDFLVPTVVARGTCTVTTLDCWLLWLWGWPAVTQQLQHLLSSCTLGQLLVGPHPCAMLVPYCHLMVKGQNCNIAPVSLNGFSRLSRHVYYIYHLCNLFHHSTNHKIYARKHTFIIPSRSDGKDFCFKYLQKLFRAAALTLNRQNSKAVLSIT